MLSLFIRNLIFTILQPGIVVGFIPYLISKEKISKVFKNVFEFNNYVGFLVFIVGILVVFYCIYDFAKRGKGTLSPADKTKELVISRLYTYSRNPMYVGIILVLIGEVIFLNSIKLLVYTIIVFIGFHLFVILVEEPRLKKDFKEKYKKYSSTVGRWF